MRAPAQQLAVCADRARMRDRDDLGNTGHRFPAALADATRHAVAHRRPTDLAVVVVAGAVHGAVPAKHTLVVARASDRHELVDLERRLLLAAPAHALAVTTDRAVTAASVKQRHRIVESLHAPRARQRLG